MPRFVKFLLSPVGIEPNSWFVGTIRWFWPKIQPVWCPDGVQIGTGAQMTKYPLGYILEPYKTQAAEEVKCDCMLASFLLAAVYSNNYYCQIVMPLGVRADAIFQTKKTFDALCQNIGGYDHAPLGIFNAMEWLAEHQEYHAGHVTQWLFKAWEEPVYVGFDAKGLHFLTLNEWTEKIFRETTTTINDFDLSMAKILHNALAMACMQPTDLRRLLAMLGSHPRSTIIEPRAPKTSHFLIYRPAY